MILIAHCKTLAHCLFSCCLTTFGENLIPKIYSKYIFYTKNSFQINKNQHTRIILETSSDSEADFLTHLK